VLINKSNYLLEVLGWQKTKDAQKKMPSKVPKPFLPEFMKNAVQQEAVGRDATAKTVDEIKEILARPRK